MGMAGPDRCCHSWVVARDRLGRCHIRSMALGLVELKLLSRLHRGSAPRLVSLTVHLPYLFMMLRVVIRKGL